MTFDELYESILQSRAKNDLPLSIQFYDKETQSVAEASLWEDYESLGDVYFFNRLKSNKPGMGGGTKVLKQLLQKIDELGIPLLNPVNSYGNLDQTQLIGYYKKHGFVRYSEEYGDDVLIYRPNQKDF
jgi:predicted GNAT family N-acyltransferase